MGLDCSHDAWNGAYSAFDRFRSAVCRAWGGRWVEGPPSPQMYWYTPDDTSKDTHPGLYEFLSHSDCDGEISPELCKHLAKEMTELLPALEILDNLEQPGGHLSHLGYTGAARRFIKGCEAAAAANEPLEFY